jgi:hypothetical protein
MGQNKIGVIVEELRLRGDGKQVTLFATVSGVEKVVFSYPINKPFDEKVGAIGIKFSPTHQSTER